MFKDVERKRPRWMDDAIRSIEEGYSVQRVSEMVEVSISELIDLLDYYAPDWSLNE